VVVEAQKRRFEQELEQLRSKLLTMSALVESAVYHGIAAVVDKDGKLAEEGLQSARVNRMEIDIDEQAISLLALQQPVASDLRLTTAALKINTDLISSWKNALRRASTASPDNSTLLAAASLETKASNEFSQHILN